MAGKANKWVLKPRNAPPADGLHLRLFAFPQAGAGAHVYAPWSEALAGSGVEVVPVELPGRNTRIKEPKPRRMGDLVSATVDGLLPLLSDKPFALFGHSMGAWLAWEAAQELAARGLPPPVKLFASGCRAPQHAADDPDAGRVMHRLGYDAFWAAFEERYGASRDLRGDAARRFLWPLLQADFECVETYEPRLGALPVPIVALGGSLDARYSQRQVEAWSACSTVEPLQAHMLAGAGHNFVEARPDEVLSIVRGALAGNAAAAAAAAAAALEGERAEQLPPPAATKGRV